MIWDFLFSSLWGLLSLTAIVVLAALALAWFVPAWRPVALAVAGGALAWATAYAKGNRDRAALEQKRKDEAVARAQARYKEISKQPDTLDDGMNRLKRGDF